MQNVQYLNEDYSRTEFGEIMSQIDDNDQVYNVRFSERFYI